MNDIGQNKHLGKGNQSSAKVNRVHATRRMRFENGDRVLGELRRGIANRGVGDVRHQVALDLPTVCVGDTAFAMQTTEGQGVEENAAFRPGWLSTFFTSLPEDFREISISDCFP
ncbi:MAG: hypothetical protein DVS81_08650 [Candidatus Accumulibacter meliphilus]|jgi:hypothetical protein|uniref:Uncharacterized protein n=1 Tax=Candidatus Accumulibacter meliphilus TaxID=2211374 RepID=A0A369XLS3_9PROT|nr:MAG: hypothetical protein DVS81_08650 [Candidatus Accumulibacter meliphilus]